MTTQEINTPYQPSHVEISKIQDLIQRIGNDAGAMERLAQMGCDETCELAREDDAFTYFNTIASLIAKIGWMADIASGLIDGSGKPEIRSGAEEWFLRDSFSRIEERMEGLK